MKLLFFQWHSFMNKGIERGLKELDIPYDTFFYQFNDWEKDDDFLEQFRAYLKAGNYTDVLSVNFSPLISILCEELGILYTAWVYDSPIHIRNTDSLKNSCNRIFFFGNDISHFLIFYPHLWNINPPDNAPIEVPMSYIVLFR